MIRFNLGDLQLSLLDGGKVWLDGGAMFGVVPKVIWEKERPADEKNRICLAMNVLLIEDGRQRILVDTGAGTKWDEKAISIYRLDARDADALLAPAGLRPDQIDIVVNTHLHFDHAGGNTVRDESGRLVPAFPNAQYVVQRGEIETARWDNERIRASYMPENFEPLAERGRFRLVQGNLAFNRYLQLRVVPGHTPHMQMALIVTPERTAAFPADLVPTASHVPYPYIMGYDLDPLTTLATKKRILPEAAREGWYVFFEHDTRVPLGVLEEHGGRLKARLLEVEA